MRIGSLKCSRESRQLEDRVNAELRTEHQFDELLWKRGAPFHWAVLGAGEFYG